jgi:cyclase
MPLAFGGGIRTEEDINLRIRNGADKVTINTLAIESPKFITSVAKDYGSQAIVVSIDVKKNEDGSYLVYKRGKEPTKLNPVEFAKQCEDAGAGEILLNSVDRDGTGIGFDIPLIQQVTSDLRIPLIALGGAGNWQHFEEVLTQTRASAVAAANIFQHSENSYYNCKQYLFENKIPVRNPGYLSKQSKNL